MLKTVYDTHVCPTTTLYLNLRWHFENLFFFHTKHECIPGKVTLDISGSPIFNGAPGNIQGNLPALRISQCVLLCSFYALSMYSSEILKVTFTTHTTESPRRWTNTSPALSIFWYRRAPRRLIDPINSAPKTRLCWRHGCSIIAGPDWPMEPCLRRSQKWWD